MHFSVTFSANPAKSNDGTLLAEGGIMNNQSDSAGMTPDLNRIGSIIASWQRHVVTAEEAQMAIQKALEPAHCMPKAELFPDPEPAVASRQVVNTLERVEMKLNLLIEHHALLLPDHIDPDILSDGVKELANANRKIEAVSLHRARTGAQLPQAVEIINRYIGQQKGKD
jgi:hypothetical protein